MDEINNFTHQISHLSHILKTWCEIIFFNTVQVGKKESLNREIQYMECT